MIDGKQLFYKGCFENNITRVDDLLDNNGDFFINFNLKPFQFNFYFGLIKSIQNQWTQK